MMKTTPACVLYSGGADSTLAAVRVLEHHAPVHLLSFRHRRMSQLEKTSAAARNLQQRFGRDTIIHRWIDMTPLWQGILAAPPHRSLSPTGIFALLLKPCLACKVAMHRLTLSYCLEHDIPTAADGAHPDGAALFPEQLEEGIAVVRAFYRRFGIAYETPVYTVDRPDFELFEQGITHKKNTGDEHLYYSNQFACHVGVLAHLHHRLTRPFDKNKAKTFRLSLEFLERGLGEAAHGEQKDAETCG
jgi:tRNA(Ile)-lysidine synthase TilS/MesJ